MPTGNLPASGKKIWEEVYNSALKGSCKGDKGCAAGSAWKAVHNAGWKKDAQGNWTKKAELEEFSLVITKASLNKKTGKMRWFAVASDTEEDSRKDNMTLELFQDFVDRIDNDVEVPIELQSEYWKGGMPYLSVSHYYDLNGKGVPGVPEDVYIDGNRLKARGEYFDNPLGRACFKSVLSDLYSENAKTKEDKVRISIAFLDWKHQHKSNDYLFERKSLEDICPECIREFLTGERSGKIFMGGQLIHLAHTRVPVNKRTLITEELSMTTKKEDAASIIGEEQAEELETLTQEIVGKSEVTDPIVVKADEETPIVEDANKMMNKHAEDTEYPDCMNEKTGEMDQDCVKRHKQMEKKSEPEVVDTKSLSDELAEFKEAVMLEIKALVTPKVEEPKAVEPVTVHPLDDAVSKLKADYDAALTLEGTADDKLRLLQPTYEQLGVLIQNGIKEIKHEVAVEDSELEKFQKLLAPLTQQMSMMAAQVQQLSQRPVVMEQQSKSVMQPPIRSIRPDTSVIPQLSQIQNSNRSVDGKTPKLRQLIEKSTY